MRGPKWVWFFVRSIFGIVLEELEMAVKSYRPTAKFFNFQKQNENEKFEDLTEEDRKIVTKFFQAKENEDIFTLKMIHLESSVQLGVPPLRNF